MTDVNDPMKKDTLKVANPGRLQLTKTVESGKVKQNFTHGRSKTVTVEVRKTRTFAQGATGGLVEVKQQPASFSQPQPASAPQEEEALRHLTPEERQVRLNALKIAEEELKRAGANPTRKKLRDALEGMREYDIGGQYIAFSPSSHSGINYVDITILNREGKLLR